MNWRSNAAERPTRYNSKTGASGFNNAVETNPKNAEAYIARAKFIYLQDDTESATKDFDKAITLKPRGAETFIERSNFYSELADYKREPKYTDHLQIP
ncbi:MAG: hypothetical protein ABI954_09085 [Pyrinomonadaceae bacterium]